MTSPTTSHLGEFQPTPLGSAAAPTRAAPAPSLLLARARRAVPRQASLFALIAALVISAGVLYDLQGGVRPLTALLFWAPIGLGAAIVIAALRELSRGTLTLLSSLNKHLGYDVLGAAPELTERALRELAPDKRSPFGCVTFQPTSPFSAAYRDLQGALRNDRIVAFVGPLAGEGASSTALCAAVSAVQQGRRVIIVDCDTRRRSTTKALQIEAERGVMECCDEPEKWRDYIQEEPETGLHVLPAARTRNVWRTLVGAPGLQTLIKTLREEYDLVILDCPPALRSGEGPVLASLADKCVAVAAWDQTPLTAIRQTVSAMQRRRAPTAIYVNRAPPGYRFERTRRR